MIFGLVPVCVIALVSISCAGIAATVAIKVLKRRSEERKKRLWRPRNSLQQYPSFVANRITGIVTIVPHGSYLVKDELLVCPQFLIAVPPPLLDNGLDLHGPSQEFAKVKPTWTIGNEKVDVDPNNNEITQPNKNNKSDNNNNVCDFTYNFELKNQPTESP